MKQILLALIFLLSLTCFSQVTKKQLLGVWKVEDLIEIKDFEIENNTEGFEEKMKIFKSVLSKGTFIFTENKFDFKLPTGTSGFMLELENMMSNQNWEFDYRKQYIMVGGNIANFIIVEKENGIHFLMEESPFLLRVKQL